VRATGHRTRNEFFNGMDEFVIRVVDSPSSSVAASSGTVINVPEASHAIE